MNTSQQQMFMEWSDDKRIAYTRWPTQLQQYYWSLTPQQQTGWWVLTDDQRNRIYVAAPQQRTQAWAAIASQMAGAPASQAQNPVGGSMMANGIQWVSNPVVQRIPPPHQGEYPVCESDADDNCMNPWEAGLRGPNVERPLGYWPGKPASEM
ncbi:hypothetical protein [Erythrobacter sp. QSSC1-22B]|uniref:hypothetical protein n=1 Tax=Erythrobacter sp. QSSC1-22B TaxID=1860125 RepID=UPI0011A77522|nr:hypothetical protein [Erythrobacter sp. QSSC1-22B]